MSIRLIVFGLLSLRAAQRTLCFFKPWFKGGTPCHVIIQNWVLCYGLYKLKQAPKKASDWIYILDHTIEFGAKKCLVILGIRQKQFKKNHYKIKHQDLTVLEIDIQERATALTVTKSLSRVSRKTGLPIQIISDNGSNIKKGVEDFIQKKSQHAFIRKTYDVTHKTALILKHSLKNDKNWTLFIDLTAKTKRSLTHTNLCFIAPPKPKDKARWLNLETQIQWARSILRFNKKRLNAKQKRLFKEKLSWVEKFKPQIEDWEAILQLLKILKKEIKTRGLSQNTLRNFEKSTSLLTFNTSKLISIKNEILLYLKEECQEMTDTYPGCSDIIESVFAKYKIFSAKSPMKEVGKAVLTIPAFTSNIEYAEVKKAMETITIKDVNKWVMKNIGKSLFLKRKHAFKQENKK